MENNRNNRCTDKTIFKMAETVARLDERTVNMEGHLKSLPCDKHEQNIQHCKTDINRAKGFVAAIAGVWGMVKVFWGK